MSVHSRCAIVIAWSAGLLVPWAGSASAATLCVNTGGTGGCFSSVQAAIDAASSGDIIDVAAGMYSGNLSLGKQLTLRGAQVGIDACSRSGAEAIVTASPGTNLLTLVTGSAGAIIDGFTFSGGAMGIVSDTGPITGLQILNNRVVGFTGNGIFLNDNGRDITAHQNLVDGSSKVGTGALFHLDQDDFDGFHLTSNCIVSGTTATGFFVDGDHNVGPNGGRLPLISGNLLSANATGANLGRFAFDGGTISGNTFFGNAFDGLQGGVQNGAISDNQFLDNGRDGLALTGFGGADDPARGGSNDLITGNCFMGNGFANAGGGVFLSATQFPGTISTNALHDNDIQRNAVGVRYAGTEIIDAEDNWWGAANGPGPPGGTGSGNGVGLTVDFTPFRTQSQRFCPNSPPDLTCLEPVVGTDADSCSAEVPCEAVANCDDIDGDATTLSCDPAGPYGLGVTDVDVTCDDGRGGSSTLTCHVTVLDDDAPMPSCEGARHPCSRRLGGPSGTQGATGFYAVHCTDNCQVARMYLTSDAPGDCGQVTVTEGQVVQVVQAPGQPCTTIEFHGGPGTPCTYFKVKTPGQLILVCVDAAGNETRSDCPER